MTDNSTSGNLTPEQQPDIHKSKYDPRGAVQEMSKAAFRKKDKVLLAVKENGIQKMKRMEIIWAEKRGDTFVYQVKPENSGNDTNLYKDEKGNNWFEEDDLVWAPKE
ncbi:MAG: hypothetical protein Q9187_002036 [Circinaria calcarea]